MTDHLADIFFILFLLPLLLITLEDINSKISVLIEEMVDMLTVTGVAGQKCTAAVLIFQVYLAAVAFVLTSYHHLDDLGVYLPEGCQELVF